MAPTPNTPPRATAESRALIAEFGRVFSRSIWLDGPWEHVRSLKGPALARKPPVPGEGRDELWSNGRPLRLSLATDATDCEDDQLVDRLFGLSRLEDVEVFVPRGYPGSDAYAELTVYDVVRGPSGEPGGVHIDEPDGEGSRDYCLFLELGWRGTAEHLQAPPTAAADAEATFLELQAHEAFSADLFVTTNPVLLGRRYGRSSDQALGVCSPREAVTIAETILRSRGKAFWHISPHGWYTTDLLSFQSALTEAKAPAVFRVLRSSLFPQTASSSDPLAGRAETLVSRYQNLLAAHDALASLALMEGHLYADNGIAREQLYHLQFAVVLATGMLDTLCWIAADLESVTPDRWEVSWQSLVGNKPNWVRDLDGDGAKIRDAARAHSARPVLDFAYHLRDAVQHRRPMRAAIAAVLDRPWSDGHRGPLRAQVTLLDVVESLHPFPQPVPTETPGRIAFHGAEFLMPHRFSRGLLDLIANVMNDALGQVEWPHGDNGWWLSDRNGVERDRLVQQAAWLFGE